MPSLIRILRKLWKHPWRNWGLLLRAGGLTVCVRGALSLFSLGQVRRGLRRTATWRPRRASSSPRYRMRAAWAAHAIGRRFLPERPCLTQALVLQYLLLRRGDDSAELHIGVTKANEELQAHAWVERSGRVLIGGTEAPGKYERFSDLEEKIRAQESSTQLS